MTNTNNNSIWLCQRRVTTAEEAAARAINGSPRPSVHGVNCLCVSHSDGHLHTPVRMRPA